MGRRVAAVGLAAVAVVVTVAGCGKSTSGTAAPTTTDTAAATAALWDPCTNIGSDILQKLGVDQSSKDTGIGGVQQPGWKDCTWAYPPGHERSVTVWSTIHTIDEFKKKADDVDFVSISIAGRDGWRYHRVSDPNSEKCDLVFPAAQSSSGAYEISFYNLDPSVMTPPCDEAVSVAHLVVPLFPK